MFVSIVGWQMCLWRAIDDEGEVLDVLVQVRCDTDAALRLSSLSFRACCKSDEAEGKAQNALGGVKDALKK